MADARVGRWRSGRSAARAAATFALVALGACARADGAAVAPAMGGTRRAPPAGSGAELARVEAAAARLFAEGGLVGLGVGVAIDGEVVLAKGYGFEDREAGVPVDPDATRFRWASVSKTVTGVLAAQLAGEGALDLDAPVERYLPGYRAPRTRVERCDGCAGGLREVELAEDERVVTPRRLAGHLAGVAHHDNGKGSPEPPADFLADARRNTGMESALPFLVDKPLVAPAGARYEYSTFGFDLLGVVLEKAARATFAELVDARVNARAGTAVALDVEARPLPRRAVGYTRDAAGTVAREGSADVAWKAAGGGLLSTTRDFTRYCAALERLLTPEEQRLAWTPQVTRGGERTAYGLGFALGEAFGLRRIAHTGAQEKTRTTLAYFPDRRLCVVAMTNATWADTRALGAALEEAAVAALAPR